MVLPHWFYVGYCEDCIYVNIYIDIYVYNMYNMYITHIYIYIYIYTFIYCILLYLCDHLGRANSPWVWAAQVMTPPDLQIRSCVFLWRRLPSHRLTWAIFVRGWSQLSPKPGPDPASLPLPSPARLFSSGPQASHTGVILFSFTAIGLDL